MRVVGREMKNDCKMQCAICRVTSEAVAHQTLRVTTATRKDDGSKNHFARSLHDPRLWEGEGWRSSGFEQEGGVVALRISTLRKNVKIAIVLVVALI